MEAIIKELSEISLSTLLVIGGFLLLFLAILEKFGAKIIVNPTKQKYAGVLGAILIFSGIALYLIRPELPAPLDCKRYGIRIVSPHQATYVGEKLTVSGTFRNRPIKMDAQLFVITNGRQYWPQDVVQFDSSNNRWSGNVYIGGETPQDVTVMVAIVGNSGRILCDHYKKVEKEKKGLWVSLDKLTDDIVQCDQIQVRKTR